MINHFLIAVVVTFIFGSSAGATSYAQPERQEILSPNGRYLLIVDPVSEEHKVYEAAHPNTELWMFAMRVWHGSFVISDDGNTVAAVGWRHVTVKGLDFSDSVTFYKADGSVKSVVISEVYPDPPKTRYVGIGPIGDDWRTWYDDVSSDGSYLTIHTTGGGHAKFDLETGTLIESHHVGWMKIRYDYPKLAVLLLLCLFVVVWFYRKMRRAKRQKNVTGGELDR